MGCFNSKELGRVLLASASSSMFVKGVISLSEKVLKNSIGKPSGPGALLFCRAFIASRTSFSDILASRQFLSSGSNLGSCCTKATTEMLLLWYSQSHVLSYTVSHKIFEIHD